jgi:hypothetical protein
MLYRNNFGGVRFVSCDRSGAVCLYKFERTPGAGGASSFALIQLIQSSQTLTIGNEKRGPRRYIRW